MGKSWNDSVDYGSNRGGPKIPKRNPYKRMKSCKRIDASLFFLEDEDEGENGLNDKETDVQGLLNTSTNQSC